MGFCRPPPGCGSRRTWSCGLWRHCTAARRTGRPCGSSDSRCRHPRPPPQNRRRACALPARADLGAGRIFAVVAGNRQVIGEDILMPDAVILLPVAARVFINTPEADLRGQVFVILAGQLAGFAPVQRLESIKIHTGLSSVTPYAFST